MAEEIVPLQKTEELPLGVVSEKTFDKEGWQPRTKLGLSVKKGEIEKIDQILDRGMKLLEVEIVDFFISNLRSDILSIGQSKGKFGGGKKSIWKQTQKKTAEGNKPHFSAMVVVGNCKGYVGIGYGTAKETLPAREKATRNAKLNLIKVRMGCGSWECKCGEPHSIPMNAYGRMGSCRIYLKPAPKGTGLVVENECKKVLALAGIKDVYSQSFGQSRTRINMIKACFEALKNLGKIKIKESDYKKLGLAEGSNG